MTDLILEYGNCSEELFFTSCANASLSILIAALVRVRCGSKRLHQRVTLATPIPKYTATSDSIRPSCSLIANIFGRKSSE